MEPTADDTQAGPSGRDWQQLNAQNRVFIMPDFCRFSLPYKEPETAEPWIRLNGTLTYQVNPLRYASAGRMRTVWPYGKYARLLLIWITTQVEKDPNNPARTIYLPDSLSDLMHQLHISRRAKGEDYKTFRSQLDAVGSMQVTITEDLSTAEQDAHESTTLSMASKKYIAWRKKPGDTDHINGYLQLTEETWNQAQHGIPLDDDLLEVLVQMNRSSHGQIIDIYMWLSRRLYALNHSNAWQTGIIPWERLQAQFGTTYHQTKEFTRKFKQSLEKLSILWSGLHYGIVPRQGIILKRSTLSVKPKQHPAGR